MKKLTVEYLIIFKQEDTFCNNENAFLNFIEVDSSIKVDRKKDIITYENKIKEKSENLDISYSIETNLVPQKEERYFKIVFIVSDIDKINLFDSFKCNFEKLISKLHEQISINVLWNDISRQYAIEGYTIINEVENLLRRLIANFMLINVGIDWAKYHIPNEVEKRNPNLKKNNTDFLYQTYFSDLKTILFDGQRDYAFRNIGEIQKYVEKCISENKHMISTDELKGVISKSLWERYFSKSTKYKKENLEKDFDNLNELRNEIAHNRHITKETLGKIKNISKNVIKALELEIKDLPNKILSQEEKESIKEIGESRLVKEQTIRNLETGLNAYANIIQNSNLFKSAQQARELHRRILGNPEQSQFMRNLYKNIILNKSNEIEHLYPNKLFKGSDILDNEEDK